MENLIMEKKIIASYLVKVELEKQNDELLEFINQFPFLFLEPSIKEQKVVETIINNPNFSKWAIKFGNHADPFVVALAKTFNLTVVTYESPRATTNRIPAACRLLTVECIDFVTFLRRVDYRRSIN